MTSIDILLKNPANCVGACNKWGLENIENYIHNNYYIVVTDWCLAFEWHTYMLWWLAQSHV